MKKSLATVITCGHICKRTTGTTPHVGGHALTGATHVIVGKHPALREGDPLLCAADPTAKVTEGSSRVIIEGRPAAVLGQSRSSHGGELLGAPSKVIIGS